VSVVCRSLTLLKQKCEHRQPLVGSAVRTKLTKVATGGGRFTLTRKLDHARKIDAQNWNYGLV
jgi:hypothetical protein